MKKGSKSAREQLIYSNLRYVVTIAKQYLVSGAALEDLIMAGCEGMTKAADKFDATLGYRFISLATWYVENEVRKTAYDYMRHDVTSLDESIDTDNEKGPSYIEFVAAHPYQSSDWNLRYRDALDSLMTHADKRQYGLGKLTTELHQMLLDGYTISDFARKHYLSESQMTRLLTILREEAGLTLAN